MAHVREHNQSQKTGTALSDPSASIQMQAVSAKHKFVLLQQLAHIAPCWCDGGKTDAMHNCST